METKWYGKTQVLREGILCFIMSGSSSMLSIWLATAQQKMVFFWHIRTHVCKAYVHVCNYPLLWIIWSRQGGAQDGVQMVFLNRWKHIAGHVEELKHLLRWGEFSVPVTFWYVNIEGWSGICVTKQDFCVHDIVHTKSTTSFPPLPPSLKFLSLSYPPSIPASLSPSILPYLPPSLFSSLPWSFNPTLTHS